MPILVFFSITDWDFWPCHSNPYWPYEIKILFVFNPSGKVKKVGGMVGRLGGTLVITFDIIESELKKSHSCVFDWKCLKVSIYFDWKIFSDSHNPRKCSFSQSDSTTIGTDSKAVEKKCLPLQFNCAGILFGFSSNFWNKKPRKHLWGLLITCWLTEWCWIYRQQ